MFPFPFTCRKKGQNRIEEQCEFVNRLVQSSKYNEWDCVWSIIGTPDNQKNACLINAIPQNRRWGILHQAVYWKSPDILRHLLAFKACDPETKVKKCISECGPTDKMTALQIARKFDYSEMAGVLSAHTSPGISDQEMPTLQPYDGYCDNKGLSLISLTLSSYKQAFHPKPVNPNKSVMSVLADVFNDISNNEARWKEVKNVVADAVYPVSEGKARDINSCQTREEFFSQVVRTYSNEDNTIYAYLNLAFRRQRQEDYMPTGDDLAMGPYCVMYQMLLLFWNRLQPETLTTYRKMKMSRQDADKYRSGTRFVWQSIVSSAVNKKHTHTFPSMAPTGDIPVLFTIQNDTNSLWRPRNIEAHADFPETERTYPAGAKFIVTDRSESQGKVFISLKLL